MIKVNIGWISYFRMATPVLRMGNNTEKPAIVMRSERWRQLTERQVLLSKLVQTTRLSVVFNSRYEKFIKAISKKWTGEHYNIASLIFILIWNEEMKPLFDTVNVDVVMATRSYFIENSRCLGETKQSCFSLLKQLKLDKILITWLQNLTGGRMEDVPTDCQQSKKWKTEKEKEEIAIRRILVDL